MTPPPGSSAAIQTPRRSWRAAPRRVLLPALLPAGKPASVQGPACRPGGVASARSPQQLLRAPPAAPPAGPAPPRQWAYERAASGPALSGSCRLRAARPPASRIGARQGTEAPAPLHTAQKLRALPAHLASGWAAVQSTTRRRQPSGMGMPAGSGTSPRSFTCSACSPAQRERPAPHVRELALARECWQAGLGMQLLPLWLHPSFIPGSRGICMARQARQARQGTHASHCLLARKRSPPSAPAPAWARDRCRATAHRAGGPAALQRSRCPGQGSPAPCGTPRAACTQREGS